MSGARHGHIHSVQVSASAADEQVRLEAIRKGDERAFEQLFHEYYDSLCDFVYSIVGSSDTAEDVVQSVLLGLWANHANWDPRAGVRAYLFTACRNQALNLAKHQRVAEQAARRAGQAGVALGVAAAASEPDRAVLQAELTDALRSAVMELPERRRMVVVLRWHHQLTNRETAKVLGISVKGVEVQFGRALASLRQRLAAFRF